MSWLAEDRAKKLALTGVAGTAAVGGIGALSQHWNKEVVENDIFLNPIFNSPVDENLMDYILDKPYDGIVGALHFLIDSILMTLLILVGEHSIERLVPNEITRYAIGYGVAMGGGEALEHMKDKSLYDVFRNQGTFILTQADEYGYPPEQVIREFYNDAHIERVDISNGMSEITWYPRETSIMEPVLMARFPSDRLTPEVDFELTYNIRNFNDESRWAQDWDFERAGFFEIEELTEWIPGLRNAGIRAGKEGINLEDQLEDITRT
jgi:hypothetical protein